DGLAALFETLLAKRREDRIPTATALAEALLPYAKTTSTEDRPAAARSLTPAAGPASPASNKPSRKRLDEKLLEPLPSLQRLAPKPKAQSARASRPVWLIPALGGGSVLVIALGLMLVLSRGGRPPATPTTDASPNTQATPTASPSTPVAAAAESTALDALVEAPPISAIEVVPPATPNEPPATDAVAAATPPMPTTPPPVPAATAKPAAEPKTIRVGPDAGMVATLKQALTDANGGDTIEIATDEPLMITEPLSWDRPGPLTIKAADGKRPIVITDQTSRPKPDVIEFEASPAGETTPTAVTIQGLSFVDRIGATSVILKTGRPLIMTDVNCVMKRPTSAVFASAAVPFVSLERCYFWMQDASGVSRQIVQLRSGNTSIRQCLFAGYGPITLGDNSQEVRCEQTTFLSNNLAWAIRGEDTRVQLHMERNLFFDLKKVGSFTSLNMATLAERPTALALAKRQLPEYRGVNNCYFQCERFNQDLAPTAAEDLAAWQQFTGNGEVDPRFIDPQFMRPDLVNLSSERLFPPKAFALKATSPIRRMKIGCDVTQLPDLPPRLYEVVPAEMRPDLKP
ncbi:MAG TPA: hypothetical protein VM165_07595, partial [Planctomycetaceae bacterium]|nr:hypothetical protein [Planctomycetaceae bacterium]